jgi:hypothetical protein
MQTGGIDTVTFTIENVRRPPSIARHIQNYEKYLEILQQMLNTPTITPQIIESHAFVSKMIFSAIHQDFTNQMQTFIAQQNTPPSPQNIMVRSTPPPFQRTAEEINSKIRVIPYHPNLNETRCAITQDDFVENEPVCQIIHCSHIFKEAALKNWINRAPNNNFCPLCHHVLFSNDLVNTADGDDVVQLREQISRIIAGIFNSNVAANLDID